MSTKAYDVIVIGSGAGAKISSYAAKQGMSVALVEEGPIGGTCLNRGCIPSKLYIHTADIAKAIREASRFNLGATMGEVDFPAVMRRVTGYVDGNSEKIAAANEKNPNIDLYRVRGKFVAERILDVNGQRISAPKILIAAGARPHVPSIEGLGDVPYITSTEALRLPTLPTSLIIIGGGYIGTEMGHFFGGLGVDVTIVHSQDRLVPNEDSAIAQKFTEVFARDHTVLLDHKATHVVHSGSTFTVSVEGSGGAKEIQAEQLLVAAGVIPNTDTLDTAAGGIDTDDKHFIVANEFLQTNVPGVWAIGDIIGRHLFRHAANWEARYTIQNMFTEQPTPVDYSAMPHAVFSNPQIAGVGATEDELKAKGIAYTVGIAEYKNTAMGEAHQEADGFVKALADENKHEILGCHIIGPEASTLIHEVIVAMKAKMDVSVITNSIHIHPAMSEVVQRAFLKLR